MRPSIEFSFDFVSRAPSLLDVHFPFIRTYTLVSVMETEYKREDRDNFPRLPFHKYTSDCSNDINVRTCHVHARMIVIIDFSTSYKNRIGSLKDCRRARKGMKRGGARSVPNLNLQGIKSAPILPANSRIIKTEYRRPRKRKREKTKRLHGRGSITARERERERRRTFY